MKVLAITFSVLIGLFFILAGCSEEEQPVFPVQKSSVRKPITVPERERAEAKEPAGEMGVEPGEKEVAEIEIASVEVVEAEEEQDRPVEEEKGFYRVQKGDTLSKIAARDDVYGDPQKWPILYRLNIELLEEIGSHKDTPDTEITEGIRLKIIEPDEARDLLQARSDDFYVVNVLSSPEKEKVVSGAIRLMKRGYPVYLTPIRVKGEDWTRVRVGFYNKRKEADREGNKIMAFMNIKDIWVTKVEEQEHEEFGGYL